MRVELKELKGKMSDTNGDKPSKTQDQEKVQKRQKDKKNRVDLTKMPDHKPGHEMRKQ